LLVGFVHDGLVFGGDGLGYADGCGAGGFYGRPCSDTGSGEEGCAEGSALFGFEKLYGVAVDVGLDLTPERAACSAATETDGFDGDV